MLVNDIELDLHILTPYMDARKSFGTVRCKRRLHLVHADLAKPVQ